MQLTTSFVGRGFQTTWVKTPAPSSNAPRQVTCMAKKKGIRCIVTLECTEARAEGGTPSRYVTEKVIAPCLAISSTAAMFLHCTFRLCSRGGL